MIKDKIFTNLHCLKSKIRDEFTKRFHKKFDLNDEKAYLRSVKHFYCIDDG